MGRLNTVGEKKATLIWASSYGKEEPKWLSSVDLPSVRSAFDAELKSYFALAALSRSTTSPKDMVKKAYALVFRCRVTLEKRLTAAIALCSGGHMGDWFRTGSFYGFSKKQGTSVRMPLLSCHPTKLCAGGCYAHDVLDAAPASVIRGVLNGLIADSFEKASRSQRKVILDTLAPHTKRAIKSAKNELKRLAGSNWTRRPFIRFSHVGEITAFPEFANELAKQVQLLSGKGVDCVVYTRHPNVSRLDPALWVVNFTLDPASYERRSWIPAYARTVFSAFGGVTSSIAEVNFLEHHRHSHIERRAGNGRVCPATLPQTKVRTCDACRCNRCFVPPKTLGSLQK
jgi:hypothetical protein